MQKRNATAAVIGAGDYIGSAIARRFAAEGYTVFAGRRTVEKLEKLKKEIEDAGGACIARSSTQSAWAEPFFGGATL